MKILSKEERQEVFDFVFEYYRPLVESGEIAGRDYALAGDYLLCEVQAKLTKKETADEIKGELEKWIERDNICVRVQDWQAFWNNYKE